ncbi:type II toxin-antitoxin system HigB family toxin [Candidatus Daviesbacteria bacterium]|nr:type II toxin-antitoxin system HigB family toxin [Candidatus Daviesbacteria bacterium]
MKVIGKGVLDEFKAKHSDASAQVNSWLAEVEEAEWSSPMDVKQRYASASIIDGNIVFNIKGNNYRLWIKVNYKNGIVLIKEVGTHSQYMKWVIK